MLEIILKSLWIILNKLKIYNLKFFIILFCGISLSSYACENIKFLKNNIFLKSQINKKIFKFNVEIADTKAKRETGLKCKKHLNENEGMLFVWNLEDTRQFWMKDTNLFLDIIFINSNLKIVEIFFNAKPYDLMTITSKKKVKFVLELKAGVLKKINIDIGDKLIF